MNAENTALTFEDYEPAAAHVAKHAPDAYELPLITTHLDAELHTVWLDKKTGTVWHAWTTPDLDADGWTLEREPAAEAQKWIEDQLVLVLDRLADPESAEAYIWAGSETNVEKDLEVLAEFEEVQLAALSAQTDDPVLVDRIIRGNISRLTNEIARLARLRGVNLAAAFGSSHGSPTRAAGPLGVTPEAARKVMAAPTGYAERAHTGYKKARQRAQ